MLDNIVELIISIISLSIWVVTGILPTYMFNKYQDKPLTVSEATASGIMGPLLSIPITGMRFVILHQDKCILNCEGTKK